AVEHEQAEAFRLEAVLHAGQPLGDGGPEQALGRGVEPLAREVVRRGVAEVEADAGVDVPDRDERLTGGIGRRATAGSPRADGRETRGQEEGEEASWVGHGCSRQRIVRRPPPAKVPCATRMSHSSRELRIDRLRVVVHASADVAAAAVADAIAERIEARPDAVLGLATGRTPIGVYDDLARRYARGALSFRRVR